MSHQTSKTYNHRKRNLKKLWKGYDDLGSEYKADQLRSMDNQCIEKEIDEQINDSEFFDYYEDILLNDY